MSDNQQGEVRIDSEVDIVTVRKAVREIAQQIGFGATDITRIVTSASELARNVFNYAGVGAMHWNRLKQNGSIGIELIFIDNGPGIPDIEQALTPGYSTMKSLGMGLSGAKRLMGEMEIESAPGKVTKVKIRKWIGRY